jgi:integrase
MNNIIGVMKVVLDWATTGAGKHALGVNPMPHRRMRAKVERDDRAIVQGAEIARLWSATSGQDRVVVALALFAGLRRGEIFGARWSDLVWPKGRQRAALHVSRAFVQRQVVTPKSAAGRRTVQLPARLVALLRDHARERPAVLLEDGADYVIRQDDGRPIDPDNWAKRAWPGIRTAAKLPETVTLHALRHTFGSLLLADGAPVKHVSEQMGHANPLITMQVYQKVLRATSATATRRLDKHIPVQTSSHSRMLRFVKRVVA